MIPELFIKLNQDTDLENLLSGSNLITTKKFALNFSDDCNILQAERHQLLRTLKNNHEQNPRYLNKPDSNAKDAFIIDEGFFVNEVTKLTVVKEHNEFILLKTIGLQDINAYTLRDFKKPHRDMQRGMFPPKLAQFLLNLVPENQKELIYDPFCGIGTVAMEAALQNLNTINSDIDPKAIRHTTNNLSWLKENFEYTADQTIFIEDATKLEDTSIDWSQITAIVTEGYLGQIIKNNIKDIKEVNDLKQLTDVYTHFLTQLKSKLTKQTTIILCVPCYQSEDKNLLFNEKLVENMKELGYNPIALVPSWLQNRLKLKTNRRKTVVYMRHNQNIGREIFCLQHIPG